MDMESISATHHDVLFDVFFTGEWGSSLHWSLGVINGNEGARISDYRLGSSVFNELKNCRVFLDLDKTLLRGSSSIFP